jgi:SAM-dependent methyltransferase
MSRLESSYYSFMNFDSAHNRAALEFYVPFFEGGGPVLELAPGRGEFLSLLRDHGVKAAGVDLDEGMVEAARAAGHEVVLGDALDYLHEQAEPGGFTGVFSSHLVEHFHPPEVERLVAGARRVLAPGGVLVMVTPNPACYAALSHDFWRDPTHIRFYDLPLLEFFCQRAGMVIEKSGVNPSNAPGPPPEFRTREPVVHPGLDEAIQSAIGNATAALRHGPPGHQEHGHDPTWAYVLAHVIKTLADRLTETQEALRSLRLAHEQLINNMYQGNDIYVAARVPEPGGVETPEPGADTSEQGGPAGA